MEDGAIFEVTHLLINNLIFILMDFVYSVMFLSLSDTRARSLKNKSADLSLYRWKFSYMSETIMGMRDGPDDDSAFRELAINCIPHTVKTIF